MNSLNTRFTLDIAKELLRLADGEKIPIKVDSSHRVSAGNQQHWSKSQLVGISGKNILFLPINGHNKAEEAPPERVKLWQSRVSPRILEIFQNLQSAKPVTRKTILVGSSFPPTAYTPFEGIPMPVPEMPVIGAPMDLPPISRKPGGADWGDLSPNQAKPTPPPAPVAPQIAAHVHVVQKSNTPLSFLELARTYEQLRSQLQEEATLSGQASLDKLRQDRQSALEMVAMIEKEISTLEALLAQFAPPSEVIETPPPIPSPPATTPMVHHPGKKDYLREALLTAMAGRDWSSPAELRKLIGYPEGEMWQLLKPLILEGKVEKQGANNQARYRHCRNLND